jgi:hypothetical protein
MLRRMKRVVLHLMTTRVLLVGLLVALLALFVMMPTSAFARSATVSGSKHTAAKVCYWDHITGYWDYTPGHWVKQPGHWVVTPGHWETTPGHWWTIPSYWSEHRPGFGRYLVPTLHVWVSGGKLWVTGSKVWVSGSKAWVSASKVWVSGRKVWVCVNK